MYTCFSNIFINWIIYLLFVVLMDAIRVCAGRRTVMEEDVTDEFLVDLVRAAASASKDN